MHTKDEKSDRIKFVTVYKTGDPAFISFAKSLLESEGIIYYFKGEGIQDLEGAGRIGTGFNQLFGPVELQVDEKDVQKAKEILEQTEQGKFDIPEDVDVEEKEDDESKDNSNNKASFKGIFAGIIIGVLVGLSINYVYNAVEKYRQKNLSWVHKVDSKKDGKPNLFYYYEKGVLVEIEQDKNFDGKIDHRCFYKDNIINYCEYDYNFDGVFENKSYFKNGVLSRVEIYLNNDKNPNVVENYVNGVIYDADYYHELTHQIWKKVLYENGIISEEYIDQDSKGEFDIIMKYNKYGRLIKITHLTK